MWNNKSSSAKGCVTVCTQENYPDNSKVTLGF